MRIAVLGGTGFVGTALAEELVGRSHQVQILSRPSFDLRKPESFEQINNETEAIVHAAGIVGADASSQQTWLTNVKGTYDLCDYLQTQLSLRYFLYLSSGAVYGYCEEPRNAASSIHPIGDYGMGKFLGELITSTALSCNTGVARIFFPYGPAQNTHRFMPKLFKRICSGEAIDLKGQNGEPLLNPIFIDDLTVALAAMVESEKTGVQNLGGQPRSLREIAELIGSLVGKDPQFRIAESLPASLYCSGSLDARTTTGLKEGLRKTYTGLKALKVFG